MFNTLVFPKLRYLTLFHDAFWCAKFYAVQKDPNAKGVGIMIYIYIYVCNCWQKSKLHGFMDNTNRQAVKNWLNSQTSDVSLTSWGQPFKKKNIYISILSRLSGIRAWWLEVPTHYLNQRWLIISWTLGTHQCEILTQCTNGVQQ